MISLYSGTLPREMQSPLPSLLSGGPANQELPLKSMKEVIDEAADMIWDWEETYGVKIPMSCNISGGEPLLRSDLFEILEEISWKGSDIYILSNGTKITKEIARKLARNKVSGVQVSIEGPEKIHEDIRGKGEPFSVLIIYTALESASRTRIAISAFEHEVKDPGKREEEA